jgi:hypothetical protein
MEIDVENLVPIRRRHVECARRPGDPRIVDQAVHLAERRLGLIEGVRHRFRVGKVERHRFGLPALRDDFGLQLLQALHAPGRENDFRAMGSQHRGETRAQPRGCPRDKGNLP